MKQQSPLRKKQKYVQTNPSHFRAIEEHLSKPTPAQLDAKRRETDQCDCDDASQCWEPCGELGHSEELTRVVPDPIRALAQGFVGGLGLGAAVVAVGAMIIGKPAMFGSMSLLLVVCMLGYLWLDDND